MRRAVGLAVLLLGLPFLLAGCDDYPKDPAGTLSRVRGGTLYAGITENPPWAVTENGKASGIEVHLVEEFARSLDAKVQWSEISGPAAMRKLEERKLDIVVGGFLESDPWKSRVGFSRAYLHGTKHVMAVPKGENAWLVALEKFLSEHEDEARALVAEARQ